MKYIDGFYGIGSLTIFLYSLLFSSFLAIGSGLFLVIGFTFCSIFMFCENPPRTFSRFEDPVTDGEWPYRSY